MKKIVGSIVIFNPKINLLFEAIESFLASYSNSEVYVWDNSPKDLVSLILKERFSDKVKYNSFFRNLGFGKGHNHNFRLALSLSSFDYFCVINPDLIIPPETIPSLIRLSEMKPNYGLFSGNIYGVDNVIHNVHKRFPTFKSYVLEQINRLFKTNFFMVENFSVQVPIEKNPTKVPILSGCFLFFTKEHYLELNGFDEDFFLYFEDYDITYRSYLMNKSLVDPKIKIIHHWQRDSHKSNKLKFVHIKSGLLFYWKTLMGKYRA